MVKGEGHVVHAGINCVCSVCGSTNSCGCVVNLGQPFEPQEILYTLSMLRKRKVCIMYYTVVMR